MKTTDVSLSVLDAMRDRFALSDATSINGLVSVKLHRVREALDTVLGPSLKAFDEVQQRFARQQDGAPVVVHGSAYIPSLTQGYEDDPAQASARDAALAPILSEMLVVAVPCFTEADARQIVGGARAAGLGVALSHFMAVEA